MRIIQPLVGPLQGPRGWRKSLAADCKTLASKGRGPAKFTAHFLGVFVPEASSKPSRKVLVLPARVTSFLLL